MESSSGADTPPAKVKRKRTYTQKYKKEWESDPEFRGWLSNSVKGPEYFHCKACNTDGKAGKSEIEKHAEGKKHIQNIKAVKSTVSVLEMPSVSGRRKEKQVKEGELRLVSFLNELNLPHFAITQLVQVVKAACPDSEIVKEFKCGRTKCTAMIKNVLGAEEEEELCELLRCNPFSLIADESTDCGCVKHLALVVKVVCGMGVRDQFLTLIPLESATATVLHEHIRKVFNNKNIPYKENMIGFAADGANVMMGQHNSLLKLLKDDIPDLFVMKCICHSLHLCASYACNKLPRIVEDVARDVYNYFQSPKQTSILKEFQEFVNVKPHKLLHPSQTR